MTAVARFRSLYEQALSDGEIAAQAGVDRSLVCRWRKRHGLPPNGTAARDRAKNQLIYERFMVLYLTGANDQEIARAEDQTRSKVYNWRIGRKLPANHPGGSLPRIFFDTKKARRLHGQGLSDPAIAEALDVPVNSICRWRARNELPANHTVRAALNRSSYRHANPLMRRIYRALPTHSDEVRDEAAAEMLLAICEGTISEDQIEAVAARFSRHTLSTWHSPFGPISFDKDLAEDFTLHGAIGCERQASDLRLAELAIDARRAGLDPIAVMYG